MVGCLLTISGAAEASEEAIVPVVAAHDFLPIFVEETGLVRPLLANKD